MTDKRVKSPVQKRDWERYPAFLCPVLSKNDNTFLENAANQGRYNTSLLMIGERERCGAGGGAPFFVGFGAHDEVKFATGEDFGVVDPVAVERFAVQGCTLDVDVLLIVVIGHDSEGIAVLERDDSLLEQRTADHILTRARSNRIDAQRTHHVPG